MASPAAHSSSSAHCGNFVFKRNSAIHRLYKRIGMFRLTADKILNIFGFRARPQAKRMRAKLQGVLEKIGHGR